MNELGICRLPGEHCSTVILPKICFVSAHDACRGPMAAAVYNHYAEKKGLSWRAVSAGLSATDNGMNRGAVEALAKKGIGTTASAHTGHVPFEVTDTVLSGCELAVCVCFDCARVLTERFPAYSHKIVTLSRDISSVADDSLMKSRKCLDALISVIRKDFEL